MKTRYAIVILVVLLGMLSVYYNYSVEQVDNRIYQSDQTMLLTDTMRNSFKVTLLNQRAQSTFYRALQLKDEDLLYDTLDYINASLGFIHSPYIDNQQLLDQIVPITEQSIELIEKYELTISGKELEQLNENFEFIRISGLKMEQDVWSKFKTDFITFQSNEYHLQLIYQMAAIGGILLSIVIGMLFLRQKILVQKISSSEQKLAASEKQFSLAMRGANDGLWDWDLITNNVYYSPRWFEMLGYSGEEFPKNFDTWKKLVSPENSERILDEVKRYIDGDVEKFQVEFPMHHKDGSLISILSRAFLVRNIDGKALRLVGTHVDITERKRSEQQINELNANLEKRVLERTQELSVARDDAERANSFKSEFLANMSHEIRTPMNAIIGMSNLALHTNLDDKQKNYIEKVHSSADNLLGIINNILDLSKIEVGKIELERINFNLIEVIDNLVNIIGLRAKENSIQLKVKIDKAVPRGLVGDPLRLGQVLNNLGGNAVKFCKSGDTITLSISVVSGSDSDSDTELQFSIEDTGIGMSEEQQEKLFQPFTQADSSTTRKFGGTGLGLTISKQIIELMGGEISCESQLGSGSTFTFTAQLGRQLNLTEVSSHSVESNAQDPVDAIASLKGSKVLLVEDNELNQELMIDLLTMKGIEVETADNGQEALDKLEQSTFDGVLMDCQMPVMDGYEATRQIRSQEKFKDLPVLALTANAMESDKMQAREAGMNDHIAKPLKPNVMFSTMAKWIKP